MDERSEFTVYDQPRVHPIALARFCVSSSNVRETILRNAKYVRNTFYTSAFTAKREIADFLSCNGRSISTLKLARERLNAEKGELENLNDKANNNRVKNLKVSIKCLDDFIAHHNHLPFLDRDMQVWKGERRTITIEGVNVPIAPHLLIRSQSRTGEPRLGGVYLNTTSEREAALPSTNSLRDSAGERVAIMLLRFLTDMHGDMGEPYADDIYYFHIQRKKYWRCPRFYKKIMNDIDGNARMIRDLWPTIRPPRDFKEEKSIRR